MKTTISLPDETFQRAKVFAVANRTTLKNVITEALEKHLNTHAPDEKGKRKTEIKSLLKQMRASNPAPMQPLSREETHDR